MRCACCCQSNFRRRHLDDGEVDVICLGSGRNEGGIRD